MPAGKRHLLLPRTGVLCKIKWINGYDSFHKELALVNCTDCLAEVSKFHPTKMYVVENGAPRLVSRNAR